jgi:hypothetical protein
MAGETRVIESACQRRYAIAMLLARNAVIALAVVNFFGALGTAAQLPVRTYTTADGLPRDWVDCFVPDSRGFLWLCTSEGLARFDGYQFRTYGVDQGLPSPYSQKTRSC